MAKGRIKYKLEYDFTAQELKVSVSEVSWLEDTNCYMIIIYHFKFTEVEREVSI